MDDLFSQQPVNPVDDAAGGRNAMTVGELNRAIESALKNAFPGAVWVRGEVQRLNRNRSGHIYFELHGEDGSGIDQIRVAALKWERERFGLDRWFDGSDPDLRIRDSLEVCIQGKVNYHPKWGLSLQLVAVDAEASLGRLEARRRRTLRWLETEGLLELNKRLPMPDLPLRVGLVTSVGSAAEKDFLTGLRDGRRGFDVRRADCRMMGERMPAQVAGAVGALGRAGVDVVVVTRGGGAKADLAWFDHPDVCAAVARCPVPVITAIGHEIDQSLADLVAHHFCKTPTAAAQDLVARVDHAADRLESAAAGIAATASARLDAARRELTRCARDLRGVVVARVRGEGHALVRLREGLVREVRRRLTAERLWLDGRAPRIRAAVDRRLTGERRSTDARAARLAPPRLLARWPRRRADLDRLAADVARRVRGVADARRRRLDGLAEKARLLDPARLLARGWSLTLDADGRLVRSAADLDPGARLRTRLRDGEIESIVERTRPLSEEADGTDGGGTR